MATKQEQLDTCNDADKVKKEIAQLVKNNDYKTLNTLLRRNPICNTFDKRTLNEDIPQKTKRFSKRDGNLRVRTKDRK